MSKLGFLRLSLGVLLLAGSCTSSTGPSQDVARRGAFASELANSPMGHPIEFAHILDAANGNMVAVGPFDTKRDAYRALNPAFRTTEETVWDGSGPGSALVLSEGETFLGWFGVPRTVIDLSCLGSEAITLDDHRFVVVVSGHGDRYLTVDGVACPAAR